MGTLVRLAFGLYSRPWFTAHDQIAWTIALEELIHSGTFSYKQLIHYPHEGGTLPISLLAFCFMPVAKSIPALSIVALMLDSFSRFVQIKISGKLFSHSTAFWFGAWSIFSIPELLPFGTAFFGLHAINAVFPFIFLYVASRTLTGQYSFAMCGAMVGLSIAFSYHNIIFVPTYILWVIFVRERSRKTLIELLKFSGTTALCVLPHVILRVFADNGFHLETDGFLPAGRPMWADFDPLTTIKHIKAFWTKTLPSSFFLSTGKLLSGALQRFLVMGFMAGGTILLVTKGKQERSLLWLSFFVLFAYSLVYALSSFFMEETNNPSFYVYRHQSYILPLLVSLLFFAFSKTGRAGFLLSCGWIFICMFLSTQYFSTTKRATEPPYTMAGWILSKKYGDDPHMMIRLASEVNRNKRDELLFGFGWGLTAHILYDRKDSDSNCVKKLVSLLNKFPRDQRPTCIEGMHFAFGKRITPALEPRFESIVETELQEGSDNIEKK